MTDKSRFLITTADMRSWKTDRPVLFLGEWCRLYDKKSVWEKMDAEVASPYGWEVGQKDKDFEYVHSLSEALLVELTETLNSFHGIQKSERYWRILLGTWLYRIVMLVYNRWSALHLAINNYSISESLVLEFPDESLIPSGYLDFARLYRLDNWNHAIYGMILRQYTKLDYEVIEMRTDANNYTNSFTQIPLTTQQKIRKYIRTNILSKLKGRPTDAFMISTHLPLMTECKLHFALGQLPIRRTSPSHPKVPPQMHLRANLNLKSGEFSGFEKFIRELIPKQLPTCYLEGYSSLTQMLDDLPWPERPKFIFTSNSYDGDEVFKAWTASKTESGIPYIIGQHGGNLGAGKYVPSELHEVATADRYITWGWEYGNPKHYPVCALNLAGKSIGKWELHGGLLLVEVSGGHREEPWDEMPIFKEYLEEQFNFVEGLPTHIRQQLTVRLFAAHLCFNWSEGKIWRDRSPSTKLDFCLKPIAELIGKSRLTVFSNNSTGILESLALNIPILIFWNTKNRDIRSSAQPYYEILKRAGIFHETPDSAVSKINEIWDDVEAWWHNEEVQNARRIFCAQFAYMPKNPVALLKKALLTTKSTNNRDCIT